MINAREELLKQAEGKAVEYVRVRFYHKKEGRVKTVEGYLEEVLPELDFNYDNGYGSRFLDGIIWYHDGSWSERAEYDGKQWWTYKQRPLIGKKV